MARDTKMKPGQLKKAVQDDVERLIAEVESAVDRAPDGAIIAGSEEAVREAMARFRQRVYEKAVQLKADAGASAFSPSDGPRQP
jgi:hypothetical protein